MAHVKTSTGFETDVDPEILDDMELFDIIEQVEVKKNYGYLPSLVVKIIGQDKKTELYDHLRNEKGRVPSGPVLSAMLEIINAVGAKNS